MEQTLAQKILLEHNVDIITGTIHLSGDVDENLYNKLAHDINIMAANSSSGTDELTIYLSTYGGDVYYGFAIYDYLKIHCKDLTIVCSGPVLSAGTIILQAADDRAMMPNSHLLVHFGMEVNETQQDKHHNNELTKDIKKLLVAKCSAKKQTVDKWFKKESYFNKRRAKDVGLVDRIVGENG